jgi:FHS family glucose/mannose:H+ symporter-like MFS transporter
LVLLVPVLVLLSFVSLLVLALLDNVRGPFYPEILHDFGVNATYGSLFFAASSLMAFLSCWRGHGFLHRHNAVILLAWSSLLLGTGFVGMALISSFNWVLVACAAFGCAYGGLNLAQAVLVSDSVTGEKRRRVFSGLHSMYGLASFAAPLLVTLCRTSGFSWRHSFLVLALFPIVVGLFSFRFRKLAHIHAEAVRPAAMNRREWRDCLLYSVLLACYLWAEISISTRLVLWLREARAFTPEAADLYLSGFFLMLLSGRVIFGYFGFRQFSNFTVLGLSGLLSSALFFGGLELDPRLLILCGLAMAPFYPAAMDQIAVHFQTKSSQALGFVIGSGSLATVAMHIFIGYVSDWGGLTLALRICAGLLALLCAFLTGRRAVSILFA